MSKLKFFSSLRFAEAKPRAKEMKEKLEMYEGVSCYVCSVGNSDNIQEDILKNYDEADMALIYGTNTYGRNTTEGPAISTFHEMNLIVSDRKPYFLMKMCDMYAETATRLTFSDVVAYEDCRAWTDGPVSEDLVRKIVEKGAAAKGVPAPKKLQAAGKSDAAKAQTELAARKKAMEEAARRDAENQAKKQTEIDEAPQKSSLLSFDVAFEQETDARSQTPGRQTPWWHGKTKMFGGVAGAVIFCIVAGREARTDRSGCKAWLPFEDIHKAASNFIGWSLFPFRNDCAAFVEGHTAACESLNTRMMAA